MHAPLSKPGDSGIEYNCVRRESLLVGVVQKKAGCLLLVGMPKKSRATDAKTKRPQAGHRLAARVPKRPWKFRRGEPRSQEQGTIGCRAMDWAHVFEGRVSDSFVPTTRRRRNHDWQSTVGPIVDALMIATRDVDVLTDGSVGLLVAVLSSSFPDQVGNREGAGGLV